MDEEIKAIEGMVKIAINMKPIDRVRTKETQTETLKILGDMITETQKKLIGYKCLKAAVKESKDNKKIAARTEYFITLELEKMAKEGK